jgi:arylsulfatase A-like enzyme
MYGEPYVHIYPYSESRDTADGELLYTRTEIDGYYKFHRVDDSTEATFTTPKAFEEVGFDIVDIRNVKSCVIEITAHTVVDSAEITRIEFDESSKIGSFHDYPFVSVDLSLDESTKEIAVSLEDIEWTNEETSSWIDSLLAVESGEWGEKDPIPSISVPITRSSQSPDIPIFLITIDTLRHDFLNHLSGVINALGKDAAVPSAPRTQGVCTWPAHASMFTGVHPGTHGSQAVSSSIIDDSVETLPAFLEELGYTCSGCVATRCLNPELGFGKGFHRYEVKPMRWKTRQFDAATNVDRTINWMNSDLPENPSQFYFLHVHDAHYPYYPPLPVTDLTNLDYKLDSRLPKPSEYRDYLQLLDEDPIDVTADDLTMMKQYYHLSLEYIDQQISKLIGEIKRSGVFDDSLIIITGDHGENFYENNFMYHHSLYNGNIRPGMVIKPPADATVPVPDAIDTIDFFPTIASVVGQETPEQCQGQLWTDRSEQKPRITERFVDTYNLSVEVDNVKGIFSFEKRGHERPAADQYASVLREEFYPLAASGYEDFDGNVSPTMKQTLRDAAQEFLGQTKGVSEYRTLTPTQEVEQRLEDLGYN